SQMLMMATGVFNFFKDKRKSFDIDPELNFEFTDTVKNLMFNQLVLPELRRIIKFHTTVKSTNIKDYDNAAQIFNFIHALNTVQDENGFNLIELIAANPQKYNEEYIVQNHKQAFVDVLKNITDENVNQKLRLWESNVEKDKRGKDKRIKFFD